MAWQKNLPGDDTKLRTSQTYVRANWDAIETGGVPYDKLKLESQGANPTREAGFGWVYGKNPGTGFTELYYEDDRNPASVIQLTNVGGIGNSTVSLYANNITFNNGTTFLDKNKQILGWLRVDANGTASGTSGDMTVAKYMDPGAQTGRYVVTFTVPTISSYVALVQISSSSGSSNLSRRSSTVTNRTANSFRVTIYSNSTGDPENEDFMVIVFGGR